MIELPFFGLAAALYSGATALAFAYLYSRDFRFSRWMLRLLTLAVAFHLCSTIARLGAFWAAEENRWFLPVNSFYGALSFLSLAVALVFALVEARHRLGILGAFVLPWACAGSLGALVRAVLVGSTEITGLDPSLRSFWINVHPMVLMTAYAVLGNAFGVGLALLVQDSQIKSRRPSELCYRLPAIEDLDGLNYRLIRCAVPALGAGIFLGGVWAHGAWGRFWGWDAKETWALGTVAIYSFYLYMRWRTPWRGRRAVYVSMLGFALALFTFVGVNFLSGLHGYLSRRPESTGMSLPGLGGRIS